MHLLRWVQCTSKGCAQSIEHDRSTFYNKFAESSRTSPNPSQVAALANGNQNESVATLWAPLAVPIAAPSSPSPITAAPSGEPRSVHRAAFAIVEHPNVAPRPARPNAQGLYLPSRGIYAERAIPHAEDGVPAGQFAQPVRYVHIPCRHAIESSENLELPKRRSGDGGPQFPPRHPEKMAPSTVLPSRY